MSDDAKWHWGEGTKFAHESMKSLLVINGAAAIAVLTFSGNSNTINVQVICGMIAFGFGVAFATTSMFFAYLTQLFYGNAEVQIVGQSAWHLASRWHYATYAMAAISMLLFLAGMLLVAVGLLCAASQP